MPTWHGGFHISAPKIMQELETVKHILFLKIVLSKKLDMFDGFRGKAIKKIGLD